MLLLYDLVFIAALCLVFNNNALFFFLGMFSLAENIFHQNYSLMENANDDQLSFVYFDGK